MLFKKFKISDSDPKFDVGDHVRISKYKNIFAKGYLPKSSKDVFVIKKVKNNIAWRRIEKKLLERFTKKNCKRQIKQTFELKT